MKEISLFQVRDVITEIILGPKNFFRILDSR